MRTLSQKIRRAQRNFIKEAPKLVRLMTNDAETFFRVDVWRDKGFDVNPGGRWKPRKKKRVGRLMVKTGNLRSSIVANARGKVGVVTSDVRSKKGVNYGKIHQEGIGRMPQRKFMGESKKLNRKFDQKIKRALRKAFAV